MYLFRDQFISVNPSASLFLNNLLYIHTRQRFFFSFQLYLQESLFHHPVCHWSLFLSLSLSRPHPPLALSFSLLFPAEENATDCYCVQKLQVPLISQARYRVWIARKYSTSQNYSDLSDLSVWIHTKINVFPIRQKDLFLYTYMQKPSFGHNLKTLRMVNSASYGEGDEPNPQRRWAIWCHQWAKYFQWWANAFTGEQDFFTGTGFSLWLPRRSPLLLLVPSRVIKGYYVNIILGQWRILTTLRKSYIQSQPHRKFEEYVKYLVLF